MKKNKQVIFSVCPYCGGGFCPDCNDCIDCGTDPCTSCCDDGRRCGVCPLCVPVTLSNVTYQYTGMPLVYNGAAFNSPVDYIRYSYSPVSGGAALGDDGLPFRAGMYRVTATFTSRAVSSGRLSATMNVTPAPLQVLGISVYDKVYDATAFCPLNYI